MNKEKKVDNPIQQLNQDPFQIFFSSMPIGANIFDSEGKVIAVNSVARSYFGISEDDPLTDYRLFEDPSIADDTKNKLRNGQSALEVRWIDFQAIHQHKMYDTKKTQDDRILIELSYAPFGSDLNTPDGYSIIIQDITERKQAEAETTYQASLLGQIDSAVITIDFDNIILSWNRHAETLYQWSRDEAVGKNIIELLSPQEMKGMVGKNFEALNVDGHWEGEFNVLKKDGSTLPAHITNTYLKDIDGNNIGFIGISIDITERKQAEVKLRESEEKHRTLFETMNDGVVYQDADGKIISANSSAERILGLTFDQMQGRSSVDPRWKSIQEDGSDLPGDTHPSMVALKTGQPVSNSIMGIFHPKEEETRWININAIPQFKPGQKKSYQVYTTFQDITERKQAELLLRETEEQLVMAEKIGHTGSWTYYIETDNFWASTEAHRIYGLSLDNDRIPIELIEACIPERKRVHQSLVDLINGVKDYHIEFSINPEDGSAPKIINSIAMLERDKQGNPLKIHGFVQDITERKQAEKSLRESEERFRLAMEASNDGLYDWNLESNEIYYSPGWKMMLGYQDHELANDFSIWEETTDKEDVKKSWALQQKLISKEIDRFVLEFKMKHKDGHWVEILSRAEAIFNDEGKAIRIVGTHTDITDRKQAEKSLQLSEERFTLAMKASNDGLFDWNLETNDIYYSPGWKKMLGYEDHELANDFSVWEKTTEEVDVKKSWELQQKLISKEIDRFVLEFKMKHKDGHWVEILSRAEAIFNGEGKAIRIVGTHTDITERKQAEAEITYQASLLEQIDSAVITIDIENTILSWNKHAEFLYQWSSAEAVGKSIIDLLAPQEVKGAVSKNFDDLNRDGHWEGEFDVLKKDGTTIPAHITNTYLKDEDGNNVGFIGISTDITERKQAEILILETEERYRDFMNSSHDGVVITGANGKFLFVNPSYATMLGYSKPAQLIGTLAAERYADPGARDEVLKVLTKDGFMKSTEIDLLTKDGTRRSVSFSAVMKKNDDGKIQQVESIVTDITERKQTEKERNQALKEAEQANQVKDQFIANISHEIRTPLNSIIGFSDLFHQRYGEQVRDKDKDIFGFITNSSNRLMRTVDSILNLSQLDAGSIKIEKRELDLNYIVRAVIGEIKLQVDEKGLDLTYNATDQHAMVLVDDYSTRQAILNLIDNAVKYTLEGKIDLRLIQKKDSYRLSIQDTGIGISEEYQKRIFDPYTQESEGFTKNFQGIGLGLALTKRYLELNDVDLELTSQKNVGSTFTLIFPKHEGDDNV